MNSVDYSFSQKMENLDGLDTASLSDAMDSLGIHGGLLGLSPQALSVTCAGPAYTALYEPVDTDGGFRNAANYIDDVPPGSVIVVSNAGRMDCTVWGDIMTHFARINQIAGTVIDGVARDIRTVRDLEYPLFSRGVFMQSGKNRVQLKYVQVAVEIAGVRIEPGDLIMGDSNGCVAVPGKRVAEVVDRAHAVEATEAKILAAVRNGASLADARRQHRYDQPWLRPIER